MELEDEHWRLCRTTVVRGVAGELEDENWLPQLTRTHTHTHRQRRIYKGLQSYGHKVPGGTSGGTQHFLCSFQLGFFSEIPCSRALGFFILPLPAAHTLMTMSWAVTAWPPVGVWEACALLRSSPLTVHCFETLLAWLPPHFL